MKKLRYIWQVSMPGKEPVEVVAVDKLEAIQAAAKKWDLPWTRIARDCEALRLRKVVDKP